jgi:hypothetical protein
VGDLRELCPLVVHIDERPAPQVGHAAYHLDVRSGHWSRGWAGDFGGSCWNRYLLGL